ncbi:hypothetical protein [Aromatoleum anaerobium]|uniref:Uncharacterized protein n=1 Tax=Aromatoleum anaerobium TaxID=182180 RepID=A0ABX1PNP4_9RHOO|nr:hypothetical protein [Aromatoleum anaerobium]MCK0506530.1 hypothetical protein [Aromatoleum anaerobium]
MTALGNVMMLIRELEQDDAAADAPVVPQTRSGIDFPAACSCVCASSLGEVVALIREMQGDSLRAFMDSLPPVTGRKTAAVAA